MHLQQFRHFRKILLEIYQNVPNDDVAVIVSGCQQLTIR